MLGVLVCENVTPADHREREFENASVNSCTVQGVPDYEGVVLSKSCEVSVIWRECQSLNTHLHPLENSNWLFLSIVPKNDGSVWKLLENSAELPSRYKLSGV